MKLDSYFIPYTKVNSKWIKDLYVIANTGKLLENLMEKLHDLGLSSDIMGRTSKALATKKYMSEATSN